MSQWISVPLIFLAVIATALVITAVVTALFAVAGYIGERLADWVYDLTHKE